MYALEKVRIYKKKKMSDASRQVTDRGDYCNKYLRSRESIFYLIRKKVWISIDKKCCNFCAFVIIIIKMYCISVLRL